MYDNTQFEVSVYINIKITIKHLWCKKTVRPSEAAVNDYSQSKTLISLGPRIR